MRSTTLELDHIERIRNATLDKFTLDKIPEWIETNTQLNNNPFSFKGHEYQQTILRDTSQEVNVIKPSQMGITEISVRLALALCGVMQPYTVIYTLPTATFASNVMGTRVDPIINGSKTLRNMVSTQINNSEIKQIGDSFLYMKGSASGNAPISIPSDHLIHDELDFSDQGIIEQYQSRLTHSPFKRKHKFSTPTLPNYGIHEAFLISRRYHEFVKCSHCNHMFIPDYYNDVKVPGWTKGLEEITKSNLQRTRWREAYLACPHCGKSPDMDIKHRQWVLENPEENHIAAGYALSPFNAPTFITPASLIQASTNYERRAQFVNFALGKPMVDNETAIAREDLLKVLIERDSSKMGVIVVGIDVGVTSYATVMLVTYDNVHIVIATEEIPVSGLERRVGEIRATYRPRMMVIDALPYTETVVRMQERDPNLYAAFYVEKKTLELHSVISKDENKEEGKLELNQVNINRNKAFDVLMDDIKSGHILKMRDENDETWISHLQDMKRVQKFTQSKELEYVRVKSSKGNDHFHHSLMYAETAARMIGVATSGLILPTMFSSFKMKQREGKIV